MSTSIIFMIIVMTVAILSVIASRMGFINESWGNTIAIVSATVTIAASIFMFWPAPNPDPTDYFSTEATPAAPSTVAPASVASP